MEEEGEDDDDDEGEEDDDDDDDGGGAEVGRDGVTAVGFVPREDFDLDTRGAFVFFVVWMDVVPKMGWW